MPTNRIKNKYIDLEIVQFGEVTKFISIICNQNQIDWNSLFILDGFTFGLSKEMGIKATQEGIIIGRFLGTPPNLVQYPAKLHKYSYETIVTAFQYLASGLESSVKSIEKEGKL